MAKARRSIKLDRAIARLLLGEIDLPPAYSSEWVSTSQILKAIFSEDAIIGIHISIDEDYWACELEVETCCPESGSDMSIFIKGYGKHPQRAICQAALEFYKGTT